MRVHKPHARVNWVRHKKWITNILFMRQYREKALRRLQQCTHKVRADLQLRSVNQEVLETTTSPLDVEGVIYAIIHLPSNKIYIGQTINSAFSRLQSHWHTRSEGDFRNINLHRVMSKQKLDNFLIFPLEKIDPALYIHHGQRNHKDFRRAATHREHFWIQQMKTILPRGFNVNAPLKRIKTRRQWRPRRWTDHNVVKNTTTYCKKCVELDEDGRVLIHNHPGHDAHIRRIVKKWLFMARNRPETHLKKDVERASDRHRAMVLRWMYQNISNDMLRTDVLTVEQTLRDTKCTYRGF